MARPVGRPRYDTRQKLIAAMRELLSERGYAATSPKKVLERAKLGQGSLYYHFTGKEQLAVETITTLMDRSLVIVNNELEGTGENGGDPSLTDDEQQPVMPEYAASSVRATASKAGIALSKLFRHKEGTALVRLLADPTATQPGPLADAITVWVKALRMLLIEIPATEGRGDDEIADTLHEATRNAETILAHALGQALLQIGTAGHLPR